MLTIEANLVQDIQICKNSQDWLAMLLVDSGVEDYKRSLYMRDVQGDLSEA